MDKDINWIKVVLAEKGGGRETIECLVEGTSGPISGWQNSWGKIPPLDHCRLQVKLVVKRKRSSQRSKTKKDT
jgi:hypothetical protein